jgi:hypothetical protein
MVVHAYNSSTWKVEARGVAQVAEYLPSKGKVNSNPSTTTTKKKFKTNHLSLQVLSLWSKTTTFVGWTTVMAT